MALGLGRVEHLRRCARPAAAGWRGARSSRPAAAGTVAVSAASRWNVVLVLAQNNASPAWRPQVAQVVGAEARRGTPSSLGLGVEHPRQCPPPRPCRRPHAALIRTAPYWTMPAPGNGTCLTVALEGRLDGSRPAAGRVVDQVGQPLLLGAGKAATDRPAAPRRARAPAATRRAGSARQVLRARRRGRSGRPHHTQHAPPASRRVRDAARPEMGLRTFADLRCAGPEYPTLCGALPSGSAVVNLCDAAVAGSGACQVVEKGLLRGSRGRGPRSDEVLRQAADLGRRHPDPAARRGQSCCSARRAPASRCSSSR